jgi:glycosyltransferase involved in cell wall biosynthesis
VLPKRSDSPVADLVVDAVIVARDHASSLAATLGEIPRRLLRSIVVVDNASRDATPAVALDAGAVVLREPQIGYGAACQRAIAHLSALPRHPDAVVFLAADGSDDPSEIPLLVAPIRADNAELVVGVRDRSHRHPPERLARGLIAAVYRHRFADLGPFRAIRFPALVAMALRDRGDGIHVEMLVKALAMGVHVTEVPVSARAHAQRMPARERMRAALGRTGRSLFHIVRHSTAR